MRNNYSTLVGDINQISRGILINNNMQKHIITACYDKNKNKNRNTNDKKIEDKDSNFTKCLSMKTVLNKNIGNKCLNVTKLSSTEKVMSKSDLIYSEELKVSLNINNTYRKNIVISNLNPLAKSYKYSEGNMYAHTGNENNDDTLMGAIRKDTKDFQITNFMAFILILCSYIMTQIFRNANLPKSLGKGIEINQKDKIRILREIRIKNINRVIIGTLNINSLPAKFEQLKVIIGKYLDILVIQETKIDASFSTEQFIISGYKKPYRLDRNRNGGGIIIYVREDIPSKELKRHNFTKNIEGLFIEINLRKIKLLLFGTYHSTHPEYGLKDQEYFEQVGLALDVYSNYEKFLLAGDFNIEEEETVLKEFLYQYHAKNLVKEKTCFKSIDNPSCIDLFLTKSYLNFQKNYHNIYWSIRFS